MTTPPNAIGVALKRTAAAGHAGPPAMTTPPNAYGAELQPFAGPTPSASPLNERPRPVMPARQP